MQDVEIKQQMCTKTLGRCQSGQSHTARHAQQSWAIQLLRVMLTAVDDDCHTNGKLTCTARYVHEQSPSQTHHKRNKTDGNTRPKVSPRAARQGVAVTFSRQKHSRRRRRVFPPKTRASPTSPAPSTRASGGLSRASEETNGRC